MFFERLLQSILSCRLIQMWQRFGHLLFSVVEIAQFVNEKVREILE